MASLVDARTFNRLKDLLDGLSTVGLLTPSLVLTDSSGQSGGLKEARWAAEILAMLEEPPAEAPERHEFWGGKLQCLNHPTLSMLAHILGKGLIASVGNHLYHAADQDEYSAYEI